MRIVSLVPSITSTLCAVGLKESIVGRTPFCVVPADLHRHTTDVKGPKDPDIELIASLHPTHIIVNEEENKPEHILACQSIANTIVTFPKGPRDVVPMLSKIASGLNANELFAPLISRITSSLSAFNQPTAQPTFMYLIWKNPYMAAGQDTYITRCMEILGWRNIIPNDKGRYPVVTLADMKCLDFDRLLLATEPYPFRKRDALTLSQELAKKRQLEIYKIDGRLTQWYGDFTAEFLELAEGNGVMEPFGPT